MGIWDNISLVENGDSPKKESDRIGFLFVKCIHFSVFSKEYVMSPLVKSENKVVLIS